MKRFQWNDAKLTALTNQIRVEKGYYRRSN